VVSATTDRAARRAALPDTRARLLRSPAAQQSGRAPGARTAATLARRRSARPGDRRRVRAAGRWSRPGAGGAPCSWRDLCGPAV